MHKLPPLLLTSCVVVSAPFTKLTDQHLRIALTLKSIENWLNIAGDMTIVVCDGSNYDFTREVSEKFQGANIECIFFKNNSELVSAYGKGYGEGEIINHALAHSIHLKKADYFAKCTSRLWVKNFKQLNKKWNNVFLCECNFSGYSRIKSLTFENVDTRFYIVNKVFYIENFASAYLNVRDEKGHYLEHCFKDVVLKKKMVGFMFPDAPVVEGVSGSSGLGQEFFLKFYFKSILKRLIFKINRPYANLISKN